MGNALTSLTLIRASKQLSSRETRDFLGSVYSLQPSLSCMICLGQLMCLSLRFHAERAIDIITHILPEDHLLLASSKRVKGKACFLEILGFCPLCGEYSGEYQTGTLKTRIMGCS